jgi:hypothetical protein
MFVVFAVFPSACNVLRYRISEGLSEIWLEHVDNRSWNLVINIQGDMVLSKEITHLEATEMLNRYLWTDENGDWIVSPVWSPATPNVIEYRWDDILPRSRRGTGGI